MVTNVGYAHVEFFDSIEGVAAAKRELIEGLPPDGVAVLNADDRARGALSRACIRAAPSRSDSPRGADVRAEIVEFACRRHALPRAAAWISKRAMTGRHAVMNLLAAIAVAQVFGIAPERLRDAVRTFAVGKMRGERMEHNGIDDLERLLQLEPGGGAVDDRRAARDAGARSASRCWGRCWSLGTRRRNCTGTWAAMPRSAASTC